MKNSQRRKLVGKWVQHEGGRTLVIALSVVEQGGGG